MEERNIEEIRALLKQAEHAMSQLKQSLDGIDDAVRITWLIYGVILGVGISGVTVIFCHWLFGPK